MVHSLNIPDFYLSALQTETSTHSKTSQMAKAAAPVTKKAAPAPVAKQATKAISKVDDKKATDAKK